MARFMKLKVLAVLLFYSIAWVINANAQVSSDVTATSDGNILKKIEKAYNVKAGGNLTVVSEFGAIDVQTAEQDKVEAVIIFSPAGSDVVNIAGNNNVVIQSNSNRGNVVIINGKVQNGSKSKLDPRVKEAVEDFEVTFEHNDADVRIEGKFKRGRKHWRKELNRLKILFQLTVPQQYNLDLNTSSGGILVTDIDGYIRAETSAGSLRFGKIKGTVWGRTSAGSINLTSSDSTVDVKTSAGSIEIGDVAANVRAQTSGGNLQFGEIQGSIWGKTSAGSIKIASCSGDADVQTSGGSIKLESVGGNVNARTSSGSIRAFLTGQPQNDCNLRTSAGSITVTLMPDIAIDLDAETSAGSVSTDFTVASVIRGKVRKNRLNGSINGGGPLLKLRTSAGSIRLQKEKK